MTRASRRKAMSKSDNDTNENTYLFHFASEPHTCMQPHLWSVHKSAKHLHLVSIFNGLEYQRTCRVCACEPGTCIS